MRRRSSPSTSIAPTRITGRPRSIDRAIRRGDFVLLDLWAKESAADSIYADFTWVAFAGDKVPAEHARIFKIVADARDAAVDLVQRRVARRRTG